MPFIIEWNWIACITQLSGCLMYTACLCTLLVHCLCTLLVCVHCLYTVYVHCLSVYTDCTLSMYTACLCTLLVHCLCTLLVCVHWLYTVYVHCLSLTTNSCWLSWRRVAMPHISPLMPVPRLLCKAYYVKSLSVLYCLPWFTPSTMEVDKHLSVAANNGMESHRSNMA